MRIQNEKLKQRVQSMHGSLKAAVSDQRMSNEVAGYAFDKYLEGVSDALSAMGMELPEIQRTELMKALDPHFDTNLGTRVIRSFAD